MTLRSLEIFLKVAETLNMQAAARALYISPPSVSEAIAEMERECGVKLFERLKRRLYLTEAGQKTRNYAQRLWNVYDEMRRGMATAQAEIRLGVTMTVASTVLLEILGDVGRPAPLVKVCNTREVEKGLLENTLDLGLVEGDVHSEPLVVTPFCTDTLMLACSPRHPFAGKKELTLSELSGADLLMREQGSGTREKLARALEEKQARPRVLWECGSVDALIRAVRANIGVSVMSARLIPSDLATVNIRDFDGSRCFSLVWHRDKYLSPALERLIAAVRAQGEGDA